MAKIPRMRWLRIQKKMTQSDVARNLNVSVQTVNCWERQRYMPSYLHLRKLQSLYGTKEDLMEMVDVDQKILHKNIKTID